MDPIDLKADETDPRFPSGPWTGFFWQRMLPGRHQMTLDLVFSDGQLEAKGTDRVGHFTFAGSYDREDGACRWTKQYLGKHQVSYTGVNKGQGIWGAWEISQLWGLYRDRGVFHIWPQGMTPTAEADLTEEAFLGSGGAPSFVKGLFVAALFLAYFLVRFYLHWWR